MSDFKDVPKSSISTDMTLGYNINIEKNKTHTYNVEFRYLNSETESQKYIIVGKSGSLITKIGTEARIELEQIFWKKVYITHRLSKVKYFILQTIKSDILPLNFQNLSNNPLDGDFVFFFLFISTEYLKNHKKS